MKRFALATLSLILAVIASPTLAGPQQERMKQCNADAKTQNLSGDARKAFMKSCLSGKTEAAASTAPEAKASAPAAAAPATQQEKMAACNKEAGGKGLKGDERKSFMSTCLKN